MHSGEYFAIHQLSLVDRAFEIITVNRLNAEIGRAIYAVAGKQLVALIQALHYRGSSGGNFRHADLDFSENLRRVRLVHDSIGESLLCVDIDSTRIKSER